MNEAKLVEDPQSEKKRDQKYFSKFKYRTKIISRKCPSGKMLGTPSFTDKKGQRPILKYFKKNVVGIFIPNTYRSSIRSQGFLLLALCLKEFSEIWILKKELTTKRKQSMIMSTPGNVFGLLLITT